jgi:hypothetical protein
VNGVSHYKFQVKRSNHAKCSTKGGQAALPKENKLLSDEVRWNADRGGWNKTILLEHCPTPDLFTVGMYLCLHPRD